MFEDLKGGITVEEGNLLADLAANVAAGCIVEVGSYRGKSAVALAMGARRRDPGDRPRIYCIEPHRPFVGFYGGRFGPADRGAYYEAMLKTLCFNDVALVNLTSEEVAPGWSEPVGLAFIDGDHRYLGVRRDFELWDPHLAPGAHLAFDDALDPECGPHALIAEILRTGRYRHVAAVGGIVVLQKVDFSNGAPFRAPQTQQRILVVCHDLVLAGGLLRFERLREALAGWGHQLAFVAMRDPPTQRYSFEAEVLSLEAAQKRRWTAVMVPGAGFPEATIEGLAAFRQAQFGTRVQHILNDQRKRAAFKAVNRAFAPHVVVFNNLSWPVGTFTDLAADRFHTLCGAVDTARFHPKPYRTHPLNAGEWVVGGLANKNPEPLIAALPHMPADVKVRLFGEDRMQLASRHPDLIENGRLRLAGPLLGRDLIDFYGEVDAIAMTETGAGWANLAAEAMASGVPLVCTAHGAEAFARHEETALMVETAGAEELAGEIMRLRASGSLCRRLAESARTAIEAFSWERYAQDLLRLIQPDGRKHYLHLPELGLFGKWPLAERLDGLQPLLAAAAGRTVVEFGSAEGVVGREFLKMGAKLLHGFELDPERVNVAAALCSAWPEAVFRVGDLRDWTGFIGRHRDNLLPLYDIVLFLGLQQHLPQDTRATTLREAVRRAGCYFAFRAPRAIFVSDHVPELMRAEGFRELQSPAANPQIPHLGRCAIYERIPRAGGGGR